LGTSTPKADQARIIGALSAVALAAFVAA